MCVHVKSKHFGIGIQNVQRNELTFFFLRILSSKQQAAIVAAATVTAKIIKPATSFASDNSNKNLQRKRV